MFIYFSFNRKYFKSIVQAPDTKIFNQVLNYAFCPVIDEKAHYAARDPIAALKNYIIELGLASESELKSIDKKIDDLVEDAVEFADASPLPPRSQLLENVFADPKGFGIGPDGKYRCEDPLFTQGTAQV